MAVIAINYKEPDPSTYESVKLSLRGQEGRTSKLFDSGDFVQDWCDLMYYIYGGENNIPEGEPLCNSSSVDHFIMDGAPFESAYLHSDNEKGWFDFEDYRGMEFFVPKGERPTWEEFKKKYKREVHS